MKIEKPQVDLFQELTHRVIERMQESLEYNTPWILAPGSGPYNPITGTQYSGVNFISLAITGNIDPRWFTFNNIQQLSQQNPDAGIHLKKGSTGIPVFKLVDMTVQGKEVNPETNEPEVNRFRVLKKAGVVFNASQVEGLPPLTVETPEPAQRMESMNELMKAMEATGLNFIHNGEGAAYFRPSADTITMPEMRYFKSEQAYYETLLHEIGHATGAEHRLNRPMKGVREDRKAYAFEELIAELTAVYTGAQFGVNQTGQIDNHAAYLKSWIQALENDKTFIFKASSEAIRATEYQLERVNEIQQERAVGVRVESPQHQVAVARGGR